MNQIRVLVIADDPLARACLVAILGDQPECPVVDQVSGGVDLASELGVYCSDVLLWDLGWDTTLILGHHRTADGQHRRLQGPQGRGVGLRPGTPMGDRLVSHSERRHRLGLADARDASASS